MNPRSLTACDAVSRRSICNCLPGYGRKLVALTILLAAGVLLVNTPGAFAKEKKPTTKTVSGVVFDDAENTIDGASVELTDVQTGKVLAIYSQEDGSYAFTNLSFSHDYKVKASYKGSSSEVRNVSSIDMRTRPVLNLTVPKSTK